MAQSVDSRRPRASPTGGGASVKHCTWTWVKREAEEKGHEEGWRRWPGFLHSHPPSAGSHPRRKCGILDSRNMNVTVCHSCSHAPGVPGKPRQTPKSGSSTCAPRLASASSPNTFMQNTQWRSERSQKPSELQSPHLGHRGLCPRQQPGETRHHWACLDHWSSGSTSSSSKDTTPEEATSETCCCLSQLPPGSGQSSWQSLHESGSSSSVGERQDSVSGEL